LVEFAAQIFRLTAAGCLGDRAHGRRSHAPRTAHYRAGGQEPKHPIAPARQDRRLLHGVRHGRRHRPAIADYFGQVDWKSFGLAPLTALALGALIVGFRAITSTPLGSRKA
jgi:hypothetical protein